jgi:hypothetical protein
MDHAVEASAQRLRDHLRRPLASSRNLLMTTAGNTLSETLPMPRADATRNRLRGQLSSVRVWYFRGAGITGAGVGLEPRDHSGGIHMAWKVDSAAGSALLVSHFER